MNDCYDCCYTNEFVWEDVCDENVYWPCMWAYHDRKKCLKKYYDCLSRYDDETCFKGCYQKWVEPDVVVVPTHSIGSTQ